jgi:hypothetical protein
LLGQRAQAAQARLRHIAQGQQKNLSVAFFQSGIEIGRGLFRRLQSFEESFPIGSASGHLLDSGNRPTGRTLQTYFVSYLYKLNTKSISS